jgi:5-methyltetrahydrofolate--homocysteine methyltransferase
MALPTFNPSQSLLLDGAWGTELQAMGLSPGACPETLNLTHPEWVLRVARRYADAGSDVILTNSFGANPVALRRYDAADRCIEINQRAVALSRRAAGEHVRVFASIGPSGVMLMLGDVAESELYEAFALQAAALADAGADALVIETMTDLDEALIALAAARTTGLSVVVSMVFDSGPDHDRTMMGLAPGDVAGALIAAGADALGANCGVGPEAAIRICRQLRAATDLPLWIKPNAGLPVLLHMTNGDAPVEGGYDSSHSTMDRSGNSHASVEDAPGTSNSRRVSGRLVYPIGPEEFASSIPAFLEAGATYLGGCCGTTPAHILAMRSAIDALR